MELQKFQVEEDYFPFRFWRRKTDTIKRRLEKDGLPVFHVHELDNRVIHVVFDFNGIGELKKEWLLNAFFDPLAHTILLESDALLQNRLKHYAFFEALTPADEKVSETLSDFYHKFMTLNGY